MPASIKAAALRLLKIRPRSVAELKEKLKAKGFPADEIDAVCGDLLASRLLDDRVFTKSWISYRLARPFGFRRIIQELKAKGIAREIIEEAVAEARGAYSPENVVLDLALRRWHRLPAGLETQKKQKRVMDFLLRRGFDPDMVIKAVRNLK